MNEYILQVCPQNLRRIECADKYLSNKKSSFPLIVPDKALISEIFAS